MISNPKALDLPSCICSEDSLRLCFGSQRVLKKIEGKKKIEKKS